LQTGRFANNFTKPNKENQQPATDSTKPTQTTTTNKDEEEEQKSNKFPWTVLDVCCAPYKLIFAPVTKLAQVVSNKL
jgi:hypothetical protein